ncbi:NPP1 family protein [Flammeovirga aprica]|uniref:Uncharacterized protein n=1 Tax=Flammeovirga aprica JL-4 TaxID=694437 RepID=A0A7X9RS70_9BACT|nr:hypothetical protein [Flammeovirga aprica]NME66900.1 hypothetical protein [Flammeovirga aprica JL-4]
MKTRNYFLWMLFLCMLLFYGCNNNSEIHQMQTAHLHQNKVIVDEGKAIADFYFYSDQVAVSEEGEVKGKGDVLSFRVHNWSESMLGRQLKVAEMGNVILSNSTGDLESFMAGYLLITKNEDTYNVTYSIQNPNKNWSGQAEITSWINKASSNHRAINTACGTCTDTYNEVLNPSTSLQVAEMFAPRLYFDKAAKTFPSTGQKIFDISKNKDCGQQLSLSSGIDKSGSIAEAETYFQITNCPEDDRRLFITYWWTYIRQDNCFFNAGGHDYDWERIVVQVNKDTWTATTVTYYQHAGWYTHKLTQNRATVYIGKIGHGAYHNSGGSGGCCYWADYRNPGPLWETWKSPIKELRCDGENWMAFDGKWGSPAQGPLYRDRNYCDLDPCKGSTVLGCTTSGCARSEYTSTNLGGIDYGFN